MSYTHHNRSADRTSPQPSARPGSEPTPSAALQAFVRQAEDAVRSGYKFDPQLLRRRIDTEAAIAGALVIDAAAASVWRGMVRSIPLEQLFTSDRIRMTVEAVLDLESRNIPPDFTTVNDWLMTRYPERGPWMLFITGLETMVFSTHRVAWHIQLLLDHWTREQVGRVTDDLRSGVLNAADLNAIIVSHSEALKDLVRTEACTVTPDKDSAGEVLNRLVEAPDAASSGIRWLWSTLQRSAGSLPRGNVAILAAPPGTGKTAAVQQQAEFCAGALGLNVLMVLMESNLDQIITRHAMQRHGVDGRNVNSRSLTGPDMDGLAAARGTWAEMAGRLHMAFPGPISGDELDALVTKWKAETGLTLDLLVVDHLNKMPSALPKIAATDHHAVSHNFMRVSQIAAREQCAVLLCAQPPKEAYTGERRLPSLGDIKNSGTPIEGAKQIVHLHYLEKDRRENAVCPGRIVIVKANDGSCGAVKTLYLQPSTLHIEDTPQNRALYTGLLRRYRFSGVAPAADDDWAA